MMSVKNIDATVLIIEGKHADFPSFTIPLQKKGFDVRVAKSGSQASAELKEISPDILVVNAASMRSIFPTNSHQVQNQLHGALCSQVQL